MAHQLISKDKNNGGNNMGHNPYTKLIHFFSLPKMRAYVCNAVLIYNCQLSFYNIDAQCTKNTRY